MLIEFYEGAIQDNQLVDAVEMVSPPRLGVHVSFRLSGNVTRYEVISVEHSFSTVTRN